MVVESNGLWCHKLLSVAEVTREGRVYVRVFVFVCICLCVYIRMFISFQSLQLCVRSTR
jgi:hypothetical protein